jgi:NAD(P)H dehydrogenase (quinone)
MKVLAVIANPKPKSFCHAIMENFKKGLEEGGHEVQVVDLYEEKFDPCINLEDFAPYSGGPPPADVQEHQEKIRNCDTLVCFYPVWWYSYPAIMKGWFDRVFTAGFAFNIEPSGPKGLLQDKKALFIRTSLGPELEFKASGMDNMMNQKINTDMKFVCGIQDIGHITFYSVKESKELRDSYLDGAYRLGQSM